MKSPALSVLSLALAAALASPLPAAAATKTWTGASGALWSNAASWLGGVPINGDDALLGTQSAVTSNVTASFASVYSGAGLNSLKINSIGIGGTFTLDQSASGSVMIAGTEIIGDTIILNAYQQSAGTNTATGITLGNQSGASGNYALSGTGTVNVSTLLVGNNGYGTFSQGGGTVNVTSFLGVSQTNTGTTSNYNLSGGTLAMASGADIGVGASRGNFTQTGGTVSFAAPNGIYVGNGTVSGVNNTYTLSGSGQIVNVGYESIGQVGGGGVATFTQTGGTNGFSANGVLALGDGGAGAYNLRGGTLAAPHTTIGGSNGVTGTFTHTAGSFSSAGGDLQIGVAVGATGIYNLSGTGTVSLAGEVVGGSGSGTFNQSGGSNSVGSQLVIGQSAAGGTGTYNLSGGTLTVGSVASGGTFYVGLVGSGALVQTGGAITLPGGNLFVGYEAGASGTYVLKAGTVNANWSLTGVFGTGSTTQSGGTHTTNLLQLGYASGSIGTYSLSSSDGASALNADQDSIGAIGIGIFNQYFGTTHTVTGTVMVGATGIYNLFGGTLAASTITVADGGLFNQTTGSVNGLLTNSGTFTYGAGSFLGSLVNNATGKVNLSGVLLAGGTVTNEGTISVGLGAGLGGVTLTNNNSLALAGGQLTGGAINNFGSIAGYGTFAGGSSLTNYGQITQAGGNLVFDSSGVNLNLGTITLAAGRQLQMKSGTLGNGASLLLNGAVVSGAGTLQNRVGGTVSGSGVIIANFANQGSVVPGAGTLNVTPAWANSGLVQLTGATSVVTGGAITNSGTIQGLGVVGAAVANTGTVEAIGGTLTVSAAMTNTGGGKLVAASGNKLLAQGGLATNAGLISLTGGTFDNGGKALANTAQITGYGTLSTGGLTNTGTLTLATGVSTVNGNLNNAAVGKVDVAYGSAIFSGAVVNNGNFKTTSANVVFAGGFTNNGSYVSDPSVQSFGDLSIGSTGTLVGGVGDVFKVSGSFVNGSTQAASWDTRAASLVLTGGGSQALVLAGADKGASFSGYTDNYSWGSLEFGSGLSLSVGSDASHALYAGLVVLDGGLGQLASINSAANIYYDGNAAGNAWLQARNYAFGSGGGALVAVVPEPASAALALLGLLAVGGRRAASALRQSCAREALQAG